jgi:hypothetical protein
MQPTSRALYQNTVSRKHMCDYDACIHDVANVIVNTIASTPSLSPALNAQTKAARLRRLL